MDTQAVCLRLAPGAKLGAQKSSEPVMSEPQHLGAFSSCTTSAVGAVVESISSRTGKMAA